MLDNETVISAVCTYADTEKGLLREGIAAVGLPEEFVAVLPEYEEHFGERNRFLWQWCWKILYDQDPAFGFSSVPPACRRDAALVKLFIILATTVTDDVSDRHQNRRLLEVMLQVPFRRDDLEIPTDLTPEEAHRVRYLATLFDEIYARVEAAPRWAEFGDLFFFDLAQTWNSFWYAYLINRHPEAISHAENLSYNSHNMTIYICGTVDALYSPALRQEDLPHLRELVWYGQQMVRIGNWVGTWEREVEEGDYSSGVMSWALAYGLITPADIAAHRASGDDAAFLSYLREAKVEERLMEEWEEDHRRVREIGRQIRSVDAAEYIWGLETLMAYFLACRGLI
ncbi:hypothetical protein RJ40_02670 [Methanofollis aquaemaris]|uniref:Uncharacterized protein n=1 Tax=Methanofollis aquaemaris TaxID=126734 RepID=A0A8A3S3M6_9EURY|nr:hypothetical protein [Methanofollis aquaemaris]QSZ66479.1 hypothetical protein RJ40_02670 [Methanofollis aquaemaris]